MTASAATDKIMGAATQAIGKAMQGLGEALGSATLKQKGVVQEARGNAQVVMSKVKAAAGPPVRH